MLRVNASSVDTDLGGGDYIYVDLVHIDEEYAGIGPNTQYIPPQISGPLVIPQGTDTIDAINIRETHK